MAEGSGYTCAEVLNLLNIDEEDGGLMNTVLKAVMNSRTTSVKSMIMMKLIGNK